MAFTTSLTRRRMLQASGLGAIALTIPLPEAMAAAPAAPVGLRRSSYVGLVGTVFAVGGGALRLVGIDDLAGASKNAALRGHEEAFVLRFTGPADAVLSSGIHELSHPEVGSATLFVSPVDRPSAGQSYEVVVDRTVRLASALGAPEVQGDGIAEAAAAKAAGVPVIAPTAGGSSVVASRAASRMRVRAKARRSGSRLATDLTFSGATVIAVRAKVMRKGRTFARGEGAVRQGHAELSLRTTRRVARGTYDLVITATDRRGHVTTITRSVSVR